MYEASLALPQHDSLRRSRVKRALLALRTLICASESFQTSAEAIFAQIARVQRYLAICAICGSSGAPELLSGAPPDRCCRVAAILVSTRVQTAPKIRMRIGYTRQRSDQFIGIGPCYADRAAVYSSAVGAPPRRPRNTLYLKAMHGIDEARNEQVTGGHRHIVIC